MLVLVYDPDEQRNNRITAHLENDGIFAHSAHCLRELFFHLDNPSLKVVCVEKTVVDHYHLNVDEILERLGFTFLVAVYTQEKMYFTFTFHHVPYYLHTPFTSAQQQRLIKKIRGSLVKLQKPQLPELLHQAYKDSNKYEPLKKHLSKFSETQRRLITIFLERKNGLSNEDLVYILNAENKENKQNYIHSYIHRLRTKLQLITGNEYIIAYKQHTYYLLGT